MLASASTSSHDSAPTSTTAATPTPTSAPTLTPTPAPAPAPTPAPTPELYVLAVTGQLAEASVTGWSPTQGCPASGRGVQWGVQWGGRPVRYPLSGPHWQLILETQRKSWCTFGDQLTFSPLFSSCFPPFYGAINDKP